jgi:iron complex outermembrane receptor protein
MRTPFPASALTLCAWAASLCCATVQAQSMAVPAATAASTASPAPSALTRLDPVVVTGSRVARRAFEAPQAISVIDAETLRSAGPQINVSEALSRVPGLTVANRSNYAQDLQISSRGFGARASFGVRGLRLYADGIPATMPDGSGQVSHFDLASAERIEVLRGPFSALYGNSSGGVIALFTPPATERQASAEVQLGSRGNRVLRGSVGAPLGGGWDLQANWTGFQTDGYRPHSEAQRHATNARLGWNDPANSLTVTAGTMTQPAQDALGLNRLQYNANPRQTTPQALTYNTRKTLEQTQLGASWQHRYNGDSALRDTTLVLYSGQRDVTQWQSIPKATQQASINQPGGVIDFGRTYSGIDARLHWRWSNQANLVAGVNLERQEDDRSGYENFIGSTLGVTGALRRSELNTARSSDVYAQGDVPLSSDVKLNAGVRSGRIRYLTTDRYLSNGDDSGALSYSYTNPVIGLGWQLHKHWNVYASAGRGFEAPTLTELAYSTLSTGGGFNTALQAQTSQQFELGSKWRDVAAAVGVDVALFRANTHNEIGVDQTANGRSTYRNVGRTTREGLEVAARWEPTEQVRTQLALTWLNARYADDALTGAGQRIAGTTPRSLFAEVAWHNAERGGSEAAVEWRAQGRTPVNDANSDFGAGFGLLAVRASHTISLDAQTDLALFGRIDNLAAKTHVGSVIVNESNGRFFETGTPRALMVGAKLVAKW